MWRDYKNMTMIYMYVFQVLYDKKDRRAMSLKYLKNVLGWEHMSILYK